MVLYAAAHKKCLNITETVMNSSANLDGHEYAAFRPIEKRGVAYSEFLHNLLLCEQFFNCVVGCHRYDFIEYALNDSVGEIEEVLVFYCDVEVGNAAFNEAFEVYHRLFAPVV